MTHSETTVDNDDLVTVSPIKRLRGEVCLPGDKSISHRAAMIASLARGKSILSNFSSAQDCSATLDCLRALGVPVSTSGSTITIHGVGLSGLVEPSQILQAQNSGTTMRLLAGVLAGQPFPAIITGDESLCSRPMSRVAEPLRLMGAEAELQSNKYAPFRITGRRPLRAIRYLVPIASAQIKSAVLLAALTADGTSIVEEPVQTRDHTERLLREFGAEVEKKGNAITVRGGVELQARDLLIPGDISSAAFLIAGAVSLPGSELFIRDVGLNPTRTGFLLVLRKLGADISVSEERLEAGEAVGSLLVRGITFPQPPLLEISGAEVAHLIDELPLLAFLVASVGGDMDLRDAGELRVKESDRIAATVVNLKRMGAHIEEHDNGWFIKGGRELHGAELSSFDDHRIAMSCAVAALSANGPSKIGGARTAVSVSLPEFWSLLESLSESPG